MMIDIYIYILTIAIILLMTITLDTQIRLEEVRDYYLRRIIYREREKKNVIETSWRNVSSILF